jgi:hypothetical protein
VSAGRAVVNVTPALIRWHEGFAEVGATVEEFDWNEDRHRPRTAVLVWQGVRLTVRDTGGWWYAVRLDGATFDLAIDMRGPDNFFGPLRPLAEAVARAKARMNDHASS